MRREVETMRVSSGKVVDGRVVVEGEPLVEGSAVTVLAPEADETFELDADAESELLEAVAEADRGDVLDAKQALKSLRRDA